MNAQLILLVHRDTGFRTTLREVLDGAGYPVEVVDDGRAAQLRLREEPPPALVLLSDDVPQEALARDGLPVIRLGGRGAASTEAGSDSPVLERPLDVDQLLTAVQRHLQAYQAG